MKRVLLVANLMLSAAILAPAQKTPESMLGAALHQEEVLGDLKGAIAAYQKVLAAPGVSRKTAAEALVRMGQSYEKLGDTEARKAYERVVREYADQKETVAIAHAGLGRTRVAAGKEMSNRRLWTLPLNKTIIYGTVSHDGRYVSYTDWTRYGDLFVHDLVTGADRQVTNTGTDGKPGAVRQHAEQCAFSRDGNQLVYAWDQGDRYELRIVDLRGNGVPQFRRLFDDEDIHWISPDDWSPDGKWLAVQIKRKDKSNYVGLVSVPDGSLRVLKSVGWRGSSKVWFSPDGKYVAYDMPQSDGSTQRDVFVQSIEGTREIPVVVHRAQNLMTGWSPDGRWLLFTSDRFGPMGLWGLPLTEGKPQGVPELIKADIGRQEWLGITNSGGLYSQVEKPVGAPPGNKIHLGAIDFATGTFLSAPGELTQGSFESNIGPSWSADGKHLAYISVSGSGLADRAMHLVVRSADGVRDLKVKLNYFYAVTWAPDGRSLMTRGADLNDSLGTFQIDAQTGEVSALRLDQPGESFARFPRWSRDGKSIYIGRDVPGGREIAFVEWDLASGNEKELVRRASLGAPNVSPDGKYIATPSVDPASNSRVILLIPTAGGEPREMIKVPAEVEPAQLTNTGKGYVVTGVIWAPDSRSFLTWKTRLAGEKSNSEVWQVPIGGDEPRKLSIKLDPLGGGLSLHPDGRQIAYSVASEKKQSQPLEVWVLENFLPVASAKK